MVQFYKAQWEDIMILKLALVCKMYIVQIVAHPDIYGGGSVLLCLL